MIFFQLTQHVALGNLSCREHQCDDRYQNYKKYQRKTKKYGPNCRFEQLFEDISFVGRATCQISWDIFVFL